MGRNLGMLLLAIHSWVHWHPKHVIERLGSIGIYLVWYGLVHDEVQMISNVGGNEEPTPSDCFDYDDSSDTLYKLG